MTFSKARWIVGLAILGLSLAACRPDHPPVFQGIMLDPISMRFEGGQVQLQVQVNDDKGLTHVGGMVLKGKREQVALNVMLPQNEAPQYTYEAVFQVPPNTSGNGDPVKYTVQLIALDTNGQESSQQAYLQVAPPPAPPAPPR